MPEVQLRVNGRDYGGWQTVDATLGVDRATGSFELSVSELWAQANGSVMPKPREIPRGAKCELRLDGEVVITGYVDERMPQYNSRDRSISVCGRDATGDLVDCAAIYKSGNWQNQTITQIAADLTAPFGVKVRATSDVGAPFESFQIHVGDTVFDTLDRLARQRGLLLMSDGRGTLLIGRASTLRAPTRLELGKNLLAANGRDSDRDRFSTYVVAGQDLIADGKDLSKASNVMAEATDKAISRYRPMIICAEDCLGIDGAQKRATWERNMRAGRSLAITYVVQGWRHKTGLWRCDRMVSVDDAWMHVKQDLYISAVRHRLSEDTGSVTELTVTMREAFDVLAIPDKDAIL